MVVQTLTPMSLYGRQPGLTHRRTCPSIPRLGAGGTPPKINASTDRICRLTHSTHSSHRTYSTYRTISPIQEESYPYNGTLDYPHIPRLPHIIVGGVYGVKNDIFYFCWGGAFPLSRYYVLNPCSLGLGLPSSLHPFVVQHPHTTIGLCGSSTIIFAW